MSMVRSREIGDAEQLFAGARQTCDTLPPSSPLGVGVTKLSRVHEHEGSRFLSPPIFVVLPEPACLFGPAHQVSYGVAVYPEYLGHLPERLLHPQAGRDPLTELAPLPDQGAGETGLRLLRQLLPRLAVPVIRQHPNQLVNLFRPARSARLQAVYRTGHLEDLLIWQRRFAASGVDLQQLCGEVLQATGSVVQSACYAGEGDVPHALQDGWAIGTDARRRGDAHDLYCVPMRLRECRYKLRWGFGQRALVETFVRALGGAPRREDVTALSPDIHTGEDAGSVADIRPSRVSEQVLPAAATGRYGDALGYGAEYGFDFLKTRCSFFVRVVVYHEDSAALPGRYADVCAWVAVPPHVYSSRVRGGVEMAVRCQWFLAAPLAREDRFTILRLR